MSEEYSIGIDLGTTYSCLACVDESGAPVVEKNYEQEDTTPSVILFNDVGEQIVGSQAKAMFMMYPPENFVLNIKRQMGSDYTVEINGNRHTPATLSAIILKKMLKDFEEAHGLDEGTIKKAVITVPAYFGQEEREATTNAGLIAGLEDVTLINEPTAAAICFGFGNNEGESKKVLVYDLGGGTFDVTILQIDGKSFTAIATDGQRLLGGKDWDEVMKRIIISKVAELTGLQEEELEVDPDVQENLLTAAEDLKKRLSTSESTRGTMNIGGNKVIYAVTREEFEDASRPLIETTMDLVAETLSSKNLTVDDIDAFLLVGGSSRMPQVEENMKSRFPGAKIKLYDPDQAIAKGAAVFCNSQNLLREKETQIIESEGGIENIDADTLAEKMDEVAKETDNAIAVHNVLSKSFGIKVGEGTGYVSNIIFRNETLPIVQKKFYNPMIDGQLDIIIDIYENNAFNNEEGLRVDLSESNLVGSFKMTLPEDVTTTTPISVKFTVSNEGMLKAFIECKEQHAEYELKTKTTMSKEEIMKYRGLVERNTV